MAEIECMSKILIVDDNKINLQIAKMVLEKKLAYEVVCTESGINELENYAQSMNPFGVARYNDAGFRRNRNVEGR